jgi:hypothetical protein
VIGTPAAEAGVISSIKGAAKKVGGKVKGAAVAVGSNVKEAAGVAKQTIKHDAPYVGRALKRAGRAGIIAVTLPYQIGKVIKHCGFPCKFSPPGLRPDVGKPLPKPPNDGPGSWGGNAGKSAVVRQHRR